MSTSRIAPHFMSSIMEYFTYTAEFAHPLCPYCGDRVPAIQMTQLYLGLALAKAVIPLFTNWMARMIISIFDSRARGSRPFLMLSASNPACSQNLCNSVKKWLQQACCQLSCAGLAGYFSTSALNVTMKACTLYQKDAHSCLRVQTSKKLGDQHHLKIVTTEQAAFVHVRFCFVVIL